jgi:hypothetical protein
VICRPRQQPAKHLLTQASSVRLSGVPTQSAGMSEGRIVQAWI